MHAFWYNDALMLQPENVDERRALNLLLKGLKVGRPLELDGPTTDTELRLSRQPARPNTSSD
jgi:hypothetical protein